MAQDATNTSHQGMQQGVALKPAMDSMEYNREVPLDIKL